MNLGILGNSYVTGVLNDYSTVEKATFTLVKLGSSSSDYKKATFETVPVQINPSDLVYQYSSPVKDRAAGLNETNGDTTFDTSFSSASSLSMTLYYDFYDEYQARTAGGALSFVSSFHLMEEKYSSLQKMIEHVNTYEKPRVLFRWGSSVLFYGVLEKLNPSYRAFSQWGHPLKAEVSVNICKDTSPNYENIASLAKKDAKSASAFSSGLNKALLATGFALR